MAKRVAIFGTCGADVDAKALQAVVRFASDTQPDEVVCTEHSAPLLEGLREGYDGPLGVHRSVTDNSFDAVLDGFGARLLPEQYCLAPGWITPANEANCPISRVAGNTALNAAKKLNTSVALGHTGRMGIGSQTFGFAGSRVCTTWMRESRPSTPALCPDGPNVILPLPLNAKIDDDGNRGSIAKNANDRYHRISTPTARGIVWSGPREYPTNCCNENGNQHKCN